jgi:hypothetical protein
MLRTDAARRAIFASFRAWQGEQDMIQAQSRARGAKLFLARGAALLALAAAAPALAQEATQDGAQEADYIAALKACRAIKDEDDRLECYDAKVGAMVSASEAGDVRIVDREDVRRTRRQLFGFTVPDLDILEGDEQDKETSELLETTVTSARQLASKAWRFTTAEGAVWEISNAPARLAPIKPQDKVVFKRASLGYYFIRINGQMGVKGKRIE